MHAGTLLLGAMRVHVVAITDIVLRRVVVKVLDDLTDEGRMKGCRWIGIRLPHLQLHLNLLEHPLVVVLVGLLRGQFLHLVLAEGELVEESLLMIEVFLEAVVHTLQRAGRLGGRQSSRSFAHSSCSASIDGTWTDGSVSAFDKNAWSSALLAASASR